jgi:hypothetical protein
MKRACVLLIAALAMLLIPASIAAGQQPTWSQDDSALKNAPVLYAERQDSVLSLDGAISGVFRNQARMEYLVISHGFTAAKLVFYHFNRSDRPGKNFIALKQDVINDWRGVVPRWVVEKYKRQEADIPEWFQMTVMIYTRRDGAKIITLRTGQPELIPFCDGTLGLGCQLGALKAFAAMEAEKSVWYQDLRPAP